MLFQMPWPSCALRESSVYLTVGASGSFEESWATRPSMNCVIMPVRHARSHCCACTAGGDRLRADSMTESAMSEATSPRRFFDMTGFLQFTDGPSLSPDSILCLHGAVWSAGLYCGQRTG